MTRTYTTRELAQIWNVSESTVKRWADSATLSCTRTPGGHRRFTLEDIHEFQKSRGFEATGLLKSQTWEDPELEESLNQKNFKKVRGHVLYLAARNQKASIEELLERLYLRGMAMYELYDEILVPASQTARQQFERKEITDGQSRLVHNNLEEAMCCLFPRMTRRRSNGKMGLCANPEPFQVLSQNAIARILEAEGWEALNLGSQISFDSMAEMVEIEPVNLVCVTAERRSPLNEDSSGLARLSQVAREYRIPVVLYGQRFSDASFRLNVADRYYCETLRSLRNVVAGLIRG